MPDLWSVSRADIDTAARQIMQDRGFKVARVYPLSSGLYVSLDLENGSHTNLSDGEIQRKLWHNRRAAELAFQRGPGVLGW